MKIEYTTCFGKLSNDPNVCLGNGICSADNVCTCDTNKKNCVPRSPFFWPFNLIAGNELIVVITFLIISIFCVGIICLEELPHF